MAGSVTFILKDPKSKVETPVYLVFWYDQIRIKVSTGERIRPVYWNKDAHRARETKQFPEYENFNTRLKDHEMNVMSAVRDHLNVNKTIIPENLRTELVKILRPKPQNKTKQLTFLGAVDEYIKTVHRKEWTIKHYVTTQNVLEDYNQTLKQGISFDSINMDFYEDFMGYMANVKKFSKNTMGTHIKNIKVFMNYALDKGLTHNTGHLHKKFKTLEETAETIYLTDKELETLYKTDLTTNRKLERVRDLFIIGCYTGLRFSDLSQLTPDNFIKGGEQLKVKTIKTGELVVIPVHWTIREILEKYNGNLPRVPSNQKMNEYIKEAVKLAKIKERITLTKTMGGMDVSTTFAKYQLVTIHTARRSFATNMFLAEVPSISIMKITGHRTEKAFMKYIKITQEQNADKLSKHPYFSQSPLKVVNQ